MLPGRPAEALPFAADQFDRVTSQFSLMFFVDKAAALREIARVGRPGGHTSLAVWAALIVSAEIPD